MMKSQLKIATPKSRIYLRPVQSIDAENIHTIASPPQVARATGSIPHPFSLGDAEEWTAKKQKQALRNQVHTFVMIQKKDGLSIGVIDMRHTEFRHVNEVGFFVDHRFWGQGFATEALRLMVDYAFENDAQLKRIFALSFPENPASERVQIKAGFKREGFLRHGLARLNEPRDAILCALVRDDWHEM